MKRDIYGLSPDERAALLTRAGGVCEVCKVAPHTDTDHDRRTRKVRGMTCRSCNARLAAVDSGKRPATPEEASYLAAPQIGYHGATVLRTARVPDDLWRTAVAKARSEGTTVTAVVVTYLRNYIKDPS